MCQEDIVADIKAPAIFHHKVTQNIQSRDRDVIPDALKYKEFVSISPQHSVILTELSLCGS